MFGCLQEIVGIDTLDRFQSPLIAEGEKEEEDSARGCEGREAGPKGVCCSLLPPDGDVQQDGRITTHTNGKASGTER